jgi:hypothetical protein
VARSRCCSCRRYADCGVCCSPAHRNMMLLEVSHMLVEAAAIRNCYPGVCRQTASAANNALQGQMTHARQEQDAALVLPRIWS